MNLANAYLTSEATLRPIRIEYLIPYGSETGPMTVSGSTREPVVLDGTDRVLQPYGWARRNK